MLKVFKLDDVYSKLEISCGKHADEVIITDDKVFIVEGTGRAKLEDVRKLIETINCIIGNDRLQSELLGRSSIKGVTMIVIIHSPRRIDSEVVDKLRCDVSNLNRSLRGRGVNVRISRRASCYEDLRVIVSHRGS